MTNGTWVWTCILKDVLPTCSSDHVMGLGEAEINISAVLKDGEQR